jgi:ABC-type multidrug transport system ATPase subunit
VQGTLTITRDGSREQRPIDHPITLGRSVDNDIVLDASDVSRRHASIAVQDGVWTFTDLGSANGSYVDGNELEPRVPYEMSSDVEFEVGPFRLTVAPLAAGARPVAAPPPPAMAGPTSTRVGAMERGTVQISLLSRLQIQAPSRTWEVPLAEAQYTLGREPGNDIVVAEDVVSRRHIMLRRAGVGYQAEEIGQTTNGITFGGRRITSRILQDGDELVIADVVKLRYFQAMAQEEQEVSGASLSLKGKREITIGRGPGNDLVLNHPMVSTQHVKLAREGTGWLVLDLQSTNGTWVNGNRVLPTERVIIKDGDLVAIGPVKLTLERDFLFSRDDSKEIGLIATGLNQRIREDLNLLQDLSFAIKPNEFVAVVGVSGAGKSTLLNALTGLKPASHGEILLNGTSLYAHYDSFRTSLGYVPQDDILHKELPVERALTYTAALRLPDDTTAAERKKRVDEVVNILGLQERRQTTVGALSGGQRKRVSIGAELITQPGLFYLDEATSGLDPGTERKLMMMLRGLADDGHTIILITHATQNVMTCDQVLFLAKGGHLAYFGPPDQALKYFDVKSFDGIYDRLEEEKSPAEWGQLFKSSPDYTRNVVSRLNPTAPMIGSATLTSIQAAPPPAARVAGARPAGRTTSGGRQFFILARRYFDIMARDRVGLALMFLLTPVLGLIDVVAWPRDVFDVTAGDGPTAMTMLFLSALFPFLIGALLFVREIVKEANIYMRERSVALKIGPYLGSKLAVAFLFALYHAAVLFIIKVVLIDFPDESITALGKLYVTLLLAVMSGVVWALLISTLTRKEEQAMILVLGVIILQVVFSGGLLPLGDLGVAGTVLGGITNTNWVFKGLAAAVGLTKESCTGDLASCEIPGVQGQLSAETRTLTFQGTDENFGDVIDANVFVCWGAIFAIMVAVVGVLYVLQRRKDTL